MRKLKARRLICIRFGCAATNNNTRGRGRQDQSSSSSCNNDNNNNNSCGSGIKWELRPGGMLVQKRDDPQISGAGRDDIITVRVSSLSHSSHDISIHSTSTFGELKGVISMVSGMEAREQRILFKGKEREDNEFLHMVGVRDKDKVLLLQDPALKEMKLLLGLSSSTHKTPLPITV